MLGRTGIQCPPNLGGHQLESIDLFDGPPSRMIGVYPGWGGWPLYKWRFPDGVYLVCSYLGTTATKEFRLPDTVRACWFGNDWPHVTCR